MNTRILFPTAAFVMLSVAVFAQVEIPEVKPKADSLQMAVDTLLLEGITITAERPLFSVEGEKTLYQVSDDPTVQGGVASDALQNAPGVSVDVEGNITLRGTSSVEIWINDQPSNLTEENLKAYIQTLPANAIDRIEVITNPSARYATTADGIINIVMNTKIKRNEFFCFGTNVSSQPYVMPWASYVWKNDKWTVNAYANTYWYHGKGEAHSEKDLYGEDEEGNQVLTSHLKSSMYNNYTTYSPGVNLNLTYTPDKMNTFSLYAMFWDSFGPSEVARGMMVDAMTQFGADSFVGRLSCIFQGSTDTTFYILAVYFGSVGVRYTRHAVAAGLLADLAGVIAAICIAYMFFG